MRKREESSESDVSQDQNAFKITSNPGKTQKYPLANKKYDESSESDISSLSEDEEDSQQKTGIVQLKNNKMTIERNNISDSQSESQESSGIDMIEQRIKRLENDLEDKIQKQKKNQEVRRNQPSKLQQFKEVQKANKIQTHSNPPLPFKKPQMRSNPTSNDLADRNIMNDHSQNRNKMNLDEKQRIPSKKQQTKIQKNQQIKESSSFDQLKKSPKKTNDMLNRQIERDRQHSKRNSDKNQSMSADLLTKAHRQINQLHKVIQQLKRQNQELRNQLTKKKKKKENQELDVLKTVATGDGLKLQKQIQTLKAIQSLQKKLKKSINKKMNINSGLKLSSSITAPRKG